MHLPSGPSTDIRLFICSLIHAENSQFVLRFRIFEVRRISQTFSHKAALDRFPCAGRPTKCFPSLFVSPPLTELAPRELKSVEHLSITSQGAVGRQSQQLLRFAPPVARCRILTRQKGKYSSIRLRREQPLHRSVSPPQLRLGA